MANILLFKDVPSILGTKIMMDTAKEKAIFVELNTGFKSVEYSNGFYLLTPICLIITLTLKVQLMIMLRFKQFQWIKNSSQQTKSKERTSQDNIKNFYFSRHINFQKVCE